MKRYELLTYKGILAISMLMPLMAIVAIVSFFIGCLLLALH